MFTRHTKKEKCKFCCNQRKRIKLRILDTLLACNTSNQSSTQPSLEVILKEPFKSFMFPLFLPKGNNFHTHLQPGVYGNLQSIYKHLHILFIWLSMDSEWSASLKDFSLVHGKESPLSWFIKKPWNLTSHLNFQYHGEVPGNNLLRTTVSRFYEKQ